MAPFGYRPAKIGVYYFSRPNFNEHSQSIKALQGWIVDEIDQELKEESGILYDRSRRDIAQGVSCSPGRQ